MLHRTTLALALATLLSSALLGACGDGSAGGQADTTTPLDVPDNPDPPRSSFTPVDLVSDAQFSKLTVEVDFVTQKGPEGDALSDVQAALDRMRADGQVAKPDGIEFALGDVLAASPAGKVWTLAELQTLATAWRNQALDANAASIHVLYVDGGYQDDTSQGTILGFAYGGSWLVMFKDNIKDACDASTVLAGPLLSALRDQVCSRTEASVLLHEFGHLFGLVNNGTPMVVAHEDTAHPKHDGDQNCLMYWALERSSAVDLIAQRFAGGGQPALGFCAASLADLAAVANP